MSPRLLDPRQLNLAPPMDVGPSPPGDGSISDTPLLLRTNGGAGLFGARRRPRNLPAPFLIRRHEGLDLLAPKDQPVFAASDGTVVLVDEDDPDDVLIAVLHRPHDLGVVSRYLHVRNPVVGAGENVRSGEHLADVAPRKPTHLHFEVRQLFTSALSGLGNRRASIALDPTMALYHWEDREFPNAAASRTEEGPAKISRYDETWRDRLRFLRVRLEDSNRNFFVPLYSHESTDHDLVATLRKAFFKEREAAIWWRNSLFFSEIDSTTDFARIISSAVLTG